MEQYIGNYWITVPHSDTEKLVKAMAKRDEKSRNAGDSEPGVLILVGIVVIMIVFFAFVAHILLGVAMIAVIAGCMKWLIGADNKDWQHRSDFNQLLERRYVVDVASDERAQQLRAAIGPVWPKLLDRSSRAFELSTTISDYLFGNGEADDETVRTTAVKLLCLYEL